MRILHVNYSNSKEGGAARAVGRLSEAINLNGNVSNILSIETLGKKNKARKFVSKIISKIIYPINNNKALNSLGIWSSKYVLDKINNNDSDIIHFHWFQHEMMSYVQIKKVNKPIVWTLHDMWPFLGCLHYDEDWHQDSSNWLEKVLIFLKKKNYPSKIQIIAPSKWIAECARRSILMKNYPIAVIPNIINTNFWKPIDGNIARKKMGFKSSDKIILIGSIAFNKDPRKGFIYIKKIIDKLIQDKNVKIIFFGIKDTNIEQKQITVFENISNDKHLRMLYSISNVVVIPSKLESFGQVALEANSCGAPVVCFDISGLAELILNGVNGYKAIPYDEYDLLKKIQLVLYEKKISSQSCLKRVKQFYSYEAVISQYLSLYRDLLSGNYKNDIEYGLQ